MPDIAPYALALEQELRAVLAPPPDGPEPLYQMLHYHLGWVDRDLQPRAGRAGKRLRPVLCLLACEAAGGDWRRALPAAASIELFHNFTLIHDDIEDDSATRHDRPTLWTLWGLAQGVNAGDALWTLSKLALLKLRDQGFPAEVVLHVVTLMEETCLALCAGQYRDISFETRQQVTLAEYETMLAGKTAALLRASLAVGAMLGGASPEQVAVWAQFGQELGLTFQIIDDILGIWGDPQTTGKSVASDILGRKKTLPVLYALAWEAERFLDDLARLYAQPALAPSDVATAIDLLERAGARAYAREQAKRHHQLTLEHLNGACGGHPANGDLAEATLLALTSGLLDRSY